MAFTSNSDDGPSKNRKRHSPSEAYSKASGYCAYQERSHKEVRNKLYGYGLYQSEVEELLTQLISEGFLNEERFAKAFAGGKFRMNKWGKNKIVHALQTHGVTPTCIQRGLREIDQSSYNQVLRDLLEKKISRLDEPNIYRTRQKAGQFAIGKGYEADLVWATLKEILK
ncbi:MAG: regulatory protein RecX [Cytophagales bacterium]|nr:regulatory protein RecX [Cytophagales bacterium]